MSLRLLVIAAAVSQKDGELSLTPQRPLSHFETTPRNFSCLSIDSHSQPSNDIHSLALSDNN